MFRQIDDFAKQWGDERDMTLMVFRALTDASLAQQPAPGVRTLGRLAWHITQSVGEMMGRVGFSPDAPAEDAPIPATAAEIVSAYERASASLVEQLPARWSDADLLQEHEMYGERWANGLTLEILIRHQAHHRAQMTVVMRLLGLRVPGVYGPAQEQWAEYGMQPQA